ncbi:MAG: hypothetical protein ACJ0RG_08120 [Candidatus Azotimanducaceae bacterium]
MSVFEHRAAACLDRFFLKAAGHFPKNQMRAYCALVMNTLLRPYAFGHSQVADAVSVTSRDLEACFGRGNFQRINSQLSWLEVVLLEEGRDYQAGLGVVGITRAYRVSASGLKAIRGGIKYLDEISPNLIVERGHLGKALQASTTTKSKSRGRFEMPLCVHLNRRALLDLQLELTLLTDPNNRITPSLKLLPLFEDLEGLLPIERIRKLVRYQVQLAQLLAIMKAGSHRSHSAVFQRYTQSGSGRWYAQGNSISLQNLPREIRNVAFTGNYLLDIDCCHWSLLNQVAARLGRELPIIKLMLEDKASFRRSIATETGATVQSIKEGLISLLFGASLEGNQSSLISLFDEDQLRRFKGNQKVLSLSLEIKSIRKTVIKFYGEKTEKRGWLVNDIGKGLPLSSMNGRQSLAFILQGAESQILSSVGSRWGRNMRLLLHDGFVSNKDLDCDELSDHVYRETGWRVSFTSEHL